MVEILGFSSRRPEKLRAPLDTLKDQARFVNTEGVGLIEKITTTLLTGSQIVRADDPNLLIVDGIDLTGFLVLLLGKIHRVPVVINLKGDPWRERKEKKTEAFQNKDIRKFAVLSVL